MKPGFEPGLSHQLEIEVTEAMCPAFDGVLVHRCYSTWSVAHHMEMAARKVLVDYLDEDEEGIGAHVSVDHLAPAAVGKRVTIRAELTEVSHGRAVCRVTAHDGDRLLATGKQVQIVMKKDRLARVLANA